MSLINDKEVLFEHFPSSTGIGGVCVGATIKDGTPVAAVALCDKETQYDPAIGESIVANRIQTSEVIPITGLTVAMAVSEVAKSDHDLLSACLKENGMTVSDLHVEEDAFTPPTTKQPIINLTFTADTPYGHYRDALNLTQTEYDSLTPNELVRLMNERVASHCYTVANQSVYEPTAKELAQREQERVDSLLRDLETANVDLLNDATTARLRVLRGAGG